MGPESDKEAFAAWVTELKEAFEPHGLLLSAAVSPAKAVIDAGKYFGILIKIEVWLLHF